MSKVYKPNQQHPAHLPHIPKPPSQGKPSIPETVYSESETVCNSIAGTSIEFGTEKIVQVEGNKAKDISKTVNHCIGTGKLISDIKNIYGVCLYCKVEADKAHKKKRITLKEAQARSLYDNQFAVACQDCGLNTCQIHTRPIQMSDGLCRNLCKSCQKKHKRKLFWKKFLKYVTTPFLEDNK